MSTAKASNPPAASDEHPFKRQRVDHSNLKTHPKAPSERPFKCIEQDCNMFYRNKKGVNDHHWQKHGNGARRREAKAAQQGKSFESQEI